MLHLPNKAEDLTNVEMMSLAASFGKSGDFPE